MAAVLCCLAIATVGSGIARADRHRASACTSVQTQSGNGTLTLCSAGTTPTDTPVSGVAESVPVCYYGDGIPPTQMLALWDSMGSSGPNEKPEHPTRDEIVAHTKPHDAGRYYEQVCAPNVDDNADLNAQEVAWQVSHDEFRYFADDNDTDVLDPGKLAREAKTTLPLPQAPVTVTPSTRSIVNAPSTLTVTFTGASPSRTLSLQSAAGPTLRGTVSATPYQIWVAPGADYGNGPDGRPVLTQSCPASAPVTFTDTLTATCQFTFTQHPPSDGAAATPYQLTVDIIWQYHYQVSAGDAPPDDFSAAIPSNPIDITVMDIESLNVP